MQYHKTNTVGTCPREKLYASSRDRRRRGEMKVKNQIQSLEKTTSFIICRESGREEERGRERDRDRDRERKRQRQRHSFAPAHSFAGCRGFFMMCALALALAVLKLPRLLC